MEIGISGSGAPAQVRYDNVSVKLLRAANSEPVSGTSPNLVAHWDFEEGAGATVFDQSGNGHDGATSGGPVWEPSPIAGGNYALRFENGKAVKVPNHPDLLPGDHSYTISAWLQTSVTSGDQTITWAQRGCCGNSQVLAIGSSATTPPNALAFSYHANRIACCTNPEWVRLQTPTSVANGEWRHVVAVRDREVGVARLYLDGVLVDAVPDSDANINTTSTFGIGHRPSDAIGINERYFNGLLDEIKIWDGALSSSDIKTLYSYERPGGGPPSDTLGPVTSNVVVDPSPLATGSTSQLTALVSDVDTGGSSILSAAYSVGDAPGEPMDPADGEFNSVSDEVVAVLPPFSTTGLYTICVRGEDAAENVGAPECTVLPVYDPTAGFVTGGGQVYSPTGADLANPSAAGNAQFAFVSRYNSGASTPSCNLQFRFREGDLNFHSSAMEWLVVTDEPRAMFRGTGTINGDTECKFQVDAWDGSYSDGTGPPSDAFGLKIFACGPGVDRYDLQARPIARGNIMIHRKSRRACITRRPRRPAGETRATTTWMRRSPASGDDGGPARPGRAPILID